MDAAPSQPIRGFRFGAFEVDLAAGELRKYGIRLRLQEKPFKILLALLEQPGEVVSREELHRRLWPDNTFVEFDHNLNNAVARLRQVLNDSSDSPRFIETLARRGYRFLAPVEVLNGFQANHTAAEVVEAAPPPPVVEVNGNPHAAARPGLWAGVVLGVALLAAGVGWLIHSNRPPLPFQERDWVLIAQFENRTGEAAFDGTLEYALERELSNSTFVSVAPRERIEDVLRLMKKPLEAPLGTTLSREICLRDGGIRVLLTGRVEKLDGTYLMSVGLVNPVDGTMVASLAEQAAGQKDALPAIARLSVRLRELLGERLAQIQTSTEKLERATTPSLRALQVYSRSLALSAQSTFEQIAAQMELAVSEDPNFASAQIVLAYAYSNLNKHADAAPHYERALELANSLPDRERYFIHGVYYQWFKSDYRKAAEAYELLLRLHPDHVRGRDKLLNLYVRQGMVNDALLHVVHAASMRPNDFRSNVEAARALLLWGRTPDFQRTREFHERAKQLATFENRKTHGPSSAMLRMFPVYIAYQQGNPQQTLSHLHALERTLDELQGMERIVLAQRIGYMYVVVGRLDDAARLAAQHDSTQVRDVVRSIRGDWESLARQSNDNQLIGYVPVIMLARAGYLQEAQRVLAATIQKVRPQRKGLAEAAEGEILLAQGRPKEAAPLLEEAVEELRGSALSSLFLAAESLARIREQQGDLNGAARILEDLAGERPWIDMWLSVPDSMRNQAYMADLYHKLGRHHDAEQIEEKLTKQLAVADSRHPFLVQINKMRASNRSRLAL